MNAGIVASDTFLRLIPSLLLFLYLCDRYFRYTRRVTYVVSFCYTLVIVLQSSLFYYVYQSFEPWLPFASMTSLLIPIVLCFVMIRISPYKLLLIFFLMENLMDGVSLYKDAFGPILQASLPTYSYGMISVLLRFLILLITYPLMILFCKHFLKPIVNIKEKQPFDRYLWLVPVCFFIMYRVCINEEELSAQVLGFPMVQPLVPTLWIIGTFLVYILILKMLLVTIDKAKLAKELEIATISTKIQQKIYENLLAQVKANRRNRHDFRHHIMVMQQYCERKEYAQLQEYVKEYIGTLDMEHQMIFCEHPVINGILQYYDEQARKQGIKCTIQANLAKDLNIKDTDLCPLLGNAIENALEASMRQTANERWIEIWRK